MESTVRPCTVWEHSLRLMELAVFFLLYSQVSPASLPIPVATFLQHLLSIPGEKRKEKEKGADGMRERGRERRNLSETRGRWKLEKRKKNDHERGIKEWDSVNYSEAESPVLWNVHSGPHPRLAKLASMATAWFKSKLFDKIITPLFVNSISNFIFIQILKSICFFKAGKK